MSKWRIDVLSEQDRGWEIWSKSSSLGPGSMGVQGAPSQWSNQALWDSKGEKATHRRYMLNAFLVSFPFPFPTAPNFSLGSPFLLREDFLRLQEYSICYTEPITAFHPSGHSDWCRGGGHVT